MKVAVMVNRSTGNESVGDMWTDVYLFDESATLKDVLLKVERWNTENAVSIKNRITINIIEEVKKELL